MVRNLMISMAALALTSVAVAQVGTTVKQGAAATSEKAQQVGDQLKGSVQSEPKKSATKAKARIHQAKAHAHAKAAKDAAKEIPK